MDHWLKLLKDLLNRIQKLRWVQLIELDTAYLNLKIYQDHIDIQAHLVTIRPIGNRLFMGLFEEE